MKTKNQESRNETQNLFFQRKTKKKRYFRKKQRVIVELSEKGTCSYTMMMLCHSIKEYEKQREECVGV